MIDCSYERLNETIQRQFVVQYLILNDVEFGHCF